MLIMLKERKCELAAEKKRQQTSIEAFLDRTPGGGVLISIGHPPIVTTLSPCPGVFTYVKGHKFVIYLLTSWRTISNFL